MPLQQKNAAAGQKIAAKLSKEAYLIAIAFNGPLVAIVLWWLRGEKKWKSRELNLLWSIREHDEVEKTHLSPKVTPTLGLKMSGFSYSELSK